MKGSGGGGGGGGGGVKPYISLHIPQRPLLLHLRPIGPSMCTQTMFIQRDRNYLTLNTFTFSDTQMSNRRCR